MDQITMETQEKRVYRDLFRIVEDNLNKEGLDLNISEGFFLYDITSPDGVLNVADIMEFDNESFLLCVFKKLLLRLPDDAAADHWRSKMGMSKDKFREQLLLSVIPSEERRIKHTKVLNNFYNKTKDKPPRAASGIKNKTYGQMYRVYKKLPESVRQLIKNNRVGNHYAKKIH